MTTVSHGKSTEKIDEALLHILRHISPKYSPFPNMKQVKKGQLPAFHDLYVDRSDIRLKIILGDEYEDVAPFISDKRITEIAPTRLKQKLLMSRLAQEIMRYEVP